MNKTTRHLLLLALVAAAAWYGWQRYQARDRTGQ